MSHNNSITSKTQGLYQNIIDRLFKEIKDVAISEDCNEEALKELKMVRENINNNFLVMGIKISRSRSLK